MSTQIGIRLNKEQAEWLDRVAAEMPTGSIEGHASRSDVVRELIAWAMREGFFGPKKKVTVYVERARRR